MINTQLIWDMYANDVKSFIFSKTKNKNATDDLTQEVFIKVHTKIATLKDVEKLKPWLFTVVRNTVLDYFRNIRKNSNIEQDNLEIVDESVVLLYEHTEHDCLYGIIKNLPKKYRDPLFMADIKGLKQPEIAHYLKLPLSTVKSQIQRARKLIAIGFVECCGYELNTKGYLVGEMKNREDCKVCN